MAEVDELGGGTDRRSRWEQLRWLIRRIARSYLLVIVIGLVIGLQLAPAVSEFSGEPVQGTVAVVPVQGGIDGQNAASLTARLQQARSDPDIEAVVLRVNSGGGSAAASEEMYMQVARTAEQMPVVTSVGAIAASGAYFTMAPSDAIYVKPASFVGSVGVIGVSPTSIDPLEQLIISGPNKLSGFDKRDAEYGVEAVQEAFLNAVFEHREDDLSLTREEVAYARIYEGSIAVENGMADRIGGLQRAIQRAAHEAGLSRYRVQVIGYDDTVEFLTKAAFTASSVEDKRLISPSQYVSPPSEIAVTTYLMMPPSIVKAGIQDAGGLRAGNVTEGEVRTNETG